MAQTCGAEDSVDRSADATRLPVVTPTIPLDVGANMAACGYATRFS